MKTTINILSLLICIVFTTQANAKIIFNTKEVQSIHRSMLRGEIELIKFKDPVSEIHFLDEDQDIIKVEKSQASNKGYKEFLIKALSEGSTVLNFKIKNELISLNINVSPNYKILENELNKHFGIKEANESQKIKVIPKLSINQTDKNQAAIFLKGEVANAKNALLALSFAAKAVNDEGIKIYSNPGGSLKNEEKSKTIQGNNDDSFINFYENSNHLNQVESIYRDIILSSKSEKVISFLKIKEAKRFKVQVRFLEMSEKYIDQFLNSLILTSQGNDFNGAVGSNPLAPPSSTFSTNIATNNNNTGFFSAQGLLRLGAEVLGGNLASGTVRLFDDTVLNILINNLLEEGVLNLVNEFSLVTHSGETVKLGKGTRFPIPRINNNVGGSTFSIEYIPIGFHGELKVSELEKELIDVQLASRLTTAETTNTSFEDFAIPIFNEQFTNNGAVLKNNQEIIISSFLTESDIYTKAKSPLARLIPFLGRSHRKSHNKNILFISLKAAYEDFENSVNYNDFLKVNKMELN